MLYSITEALGTGSPQLIAVPPFLSRSHITVYVDSLPTTGFEWLSDSTIRITAGANHPIRVVRQSSPGTRMSTYLDGQGLPAASLELDSKQAFYLAQEAMDLAYLGGSAGGVPQAGLEATTSGLKALLAGALTTSELATALRTPIELIDANASVVNSPAWRVAQEAIARAAAITAEQTARASALATEAANRGAAITAESTVRQAAEASLASSITTLTASTGANAAAIANEVTARTNADSTMASQISTIVATQNTDRTNLTALVATEQTARTTADSALATTAETNRASLQGQVNTLTSSISTVDSASVSRDTALSSRVTTLEAAVIRGGGYDDTAVRALITTADAARVAGDSALAARVTSLRAGSYGLALNPDIELLAPDEFWSRYGGGTINHVGGSMAGRNAFRCSAAQGNVVPLQYIPVDQTRAYKVSGRFRRDASTSTGRTFYLAVRLFRADGTDIAVDGSWWFYPHTGTPNTSWTDYSATFGAGTARTFPTDAVWMVPGAILFYNGTGSAGTVGYHEVESLRLDDYEVSRRTTELNATINTVDSARITDRDAAAIRLSALESKMGTPAGGNVTAAIAQEANARVNSDNAIATDLSTLQTSVSGAGGVLTRLGTVETSASTSASKVAGVESQWTLKVQARTDGKSAIAGIGLNATSNTTVAQSELILMADRIKFVASNADVNAAPVTILAAGLVDGAATLVIPSTRMGDQTIAGRMVVDGGIEARHLKVSSGLGLNLNPDPTYLDPTAWQDGWWGPKHVQVVDTTGPCFYAGATQRSLRLARRFPVVIGRRYKVSVRLWRSSTSNGTAFLRVDRDNVQASGYSQVTIGIENVAPPAATWTQYSAEWVADYPWASPMLLTSYGGTTGEYYATDLRFEEMVGGDVIVDGSLTAAKIDTRGLTIKDGAGNVIFAAGTPVPTSVLPSGILNSELASTIASAATTATWASVSGSGKPQDNATVGASFGVNIGGQITALNVSTYIQTAAIGNAQIGGDIWSDNYVAGVSGWAIKRSGVAEFRDVVVRGDIQATSLNGTSIVNTQHISAGAITSVLPASGTGASVSTNVTPPSGETWRVVVTAFQAAGAETYTTTAGVGDAPASVSLTGLGTVIAPRVKTGEAMAEGGSTFYHRTMPITLTYVTDITGPATYVTTFSGESGVYKAITMVAYKR